MFPRISGGKIWLPYTVETEDGARGCGSRELRPEDPSYEETKRWLEALQRGEWSLFLAQGSGELNQVDRFKDAWKL
jgi:hypothetical protein